MRIELLDLNGERAVYHGVSAYRFANQETYGLTEKLEFDGETLLIVNTNNFVALKVEGDT